MMNRLLIPGIAMAALLAGGCSAKSGRISDASAGRDQTSVIDQRLASIELDMKARLDAMLGLVNDQSRTAVEASGDSVIDKRLATMDVQAAVNTAVDAALARFGTGDKTKSSSDTLGPNAMKEEIDQTQQGLINYQAAGVTTIGLLLLANTAGFWAYRIRVNDNEHSTNRQKDADENETERMRILGKSNESLLHEVKCSYRLARGTDEMSDT